MTTRITPIRQTRTAVLLVGIVFAVTAVGALSAGAALVSAQTAGSDLRIAARQLDNGKVEFAIQVHDGDSWGSRFLPRTRLFPADATVGRWLVSTPVVTVAGNARVVARRLDTGKVEFAIQVHDGDSWGSRLLPRTRLFPADATVERWLVSTPVTITRDRTDPGCYEYPAHVPEHTRERIGCLPNDGTVRLFLDHFRENPDDPASLDDNPDFHVIYIDGPLPRHSTRSRPIDVEVGTRIETYSTNPTFGYDNVVTVLEFLGLSESPWTWSPDDWFRETSACLELYRWEINPEQTPSYQQEVIARQFIVRSFRPAPDGQYTTSGGVGLGAIWRGPC